MKYVPLALLVLGIAFMVIAMKMSDRRTEYDDGGFIVQLATGMAGAACFVVAIVWFLILGFQAL